MDVLIRDMHSAEYSLLRHFLYEAIFVPEGQPKPPEAIVEHPSLRRYVEDFGQKEGDVCLCAEVGRKVAGAVWGRNMAEDVEKEKQMELAISLDKEYRGQGIGTVLLRGLLRKLEKKEYKNIYLSVQKKNPAWRWYQREGFAIVDVRRVDFLMVCRLGAINK